MRRPRVWFVLACGLLTVLPALWLAYARDRTAEQLETDPLRPAVTIAGPSAADSSVPPSLGSESPLPSSPTVSPSSQPRLTTSLPAVSLDETPQTEVESSTSARLQDSSAGASTTLLVHPYTTVLGEGP